MFIKLTRHIKKSPLHFNRNKTKLKNSIDVTITTFLSLLKCPTSHKLILLTLVPVCFLVDQGACFLATRGLL